MRKLLLSGLTVAAVAIAGFSASGAFFSDEEVSTGNILQAGSIELGLDNESYYNGLFNQGTSWDLTFDVDDEGAPYLFLNFLDLKPGDYGEDTISIHVDDNDSWVCADITLTSNDENDVTEPEDDLEDTEPDGELAQRVNFIWWADDGDNVLEDDEQVLPGGPLGALGVGETATVPLADSQINIWDEGPLPGGTTRYVGKAWCFGEISTLPLLQDEQTDAWDPSLDNDGNQTAGEPEDGGYTCNGENETNISQTDSLTADIGFRAVQSRHNADFVCEPPEVEPQPSISPSPSPSVSPSPTPPLV